MREQILALVERREAERRYVGPEMAHRMRVEGGDDNRPAHMEAHCDGAAHHRLVAQMEAVEIAKRDHRPAKGVGNRLIMLEMLHWGAALSALGRRCKSAGNGGFPL